LTSLINEYIYNTCFEPVQVFNASKMDLINVGRNIRVKFDALFGQCDDNIDTVIIENQISPLANRMKTIQGMIVQYFIMKNPSIHIEFISASNKLKGCTIENGLKGIKEIKGEEINASEKAKYNNRKKMGVQRCLEIIHSDFQEQSTFFTNHSKKDDLSDCFLQGMWFIENRK